MAITKDQILAGLKKVGPCSPGELADHLQAERSVVGHHLRGLIDAKQVKAIGVTNSRRVALPDQQFSDSPSAPQRHRSAPKKRAKATARKPRRAKRKKKANGAFLPALTAEGGIVLIGEGAPQVLSPAQTDAIVKLVFAHFEE